MSFLSSVFGQLDAPSAGSDWIDIRVPRIGRQALSCDQAEARLVLGGLRLALSRMHPNDQATRLPSVARLDARLCEFIRDDRWSVLDDASLLAHTLVEARELLDPAAVLALQRWYRRASERREKGGESDGFLNTMALASR